MKNIALFFVAVFSLLSCAERTERAISPQQLADVFTLA